MHISDAIDAIHKATGLNIPEATHDFAVTFDDGGNVTYIHYVSNKEKCVKCFSEAVNTKMSENGDGNYVTAYPF